MRGLIGSAPAGALETVMQAVAESASDKFCVLVDELLNEGHSPTHFARQLVRFLRNVTVAKIAGKDSPLLQISSDERARVARIAELFSEEELARYLQIMLRTHGELGYGQEQRFHLELGLLKMAHAQRLLPIEQLLSEAASSPPPSRPAVIRNLAASAEIRRADAPRRNLAQPPFRPSRPIRRARAGRKPNYPLSPIAGSGTLDVGSGDQRRVMGSAAPADRRAADDPSSERRTASSAPLPTRSVMPS